MRSLVFIIFGTLSLVIGIIIALLLYRGKVADNYYITSSINKSNNIISSNNVSSKVDIKNNSNLSMADAFAIASPSVAIIYSSFAVDDNRNIDNNTQIGSGIVISEDGYLVTNYHVIQNSVNSFIILDNKQYKVSVVGYDKLTDIALLKIASSGEKFRAIKRNTLKLRVGDPVIAIGNPFNIGQSATSGIISALSRVNVGKIGYQNFIQTDTVLNYGNSGGALVNIRGELIGVNTLFINDLSGVNVQGLGFALEANQVFFISEQLKEYGHVKRGYFGATSAIGEDNLIIDNKHEQYTLVTSVVKDGPADKAGLKVGDKILSFNGIKIVNPIEIVEFVTNNPNKQVEVKIMRDNKIIKLKVFLTEAAS